MKNRGIFLVRPYGRILALTLLGLIATTLEAQSRLDVIFESGSQPADYIVAIDRSGSMDQYWDVVMTGTAEFVQALPEGDHISIVLFDRYASNVTIMPRTISAETRVNLHRELLQLGTPTGRGSQSATDLGRGLEAVIGEIVRPEGNQLQFIFVFSDFIHSPANDSQFAGARASNSWSALSERSALARGSRLVQSFALQLPLSDQVGRDLALARQVFPDIIPVSIADQTALREWFARQKAEIARSKLQLLTDRDVAKGWRIAPASDNSIAIVSNLQKLALEAEITTLNADDFLVTLHGENRWSIPPGATIQIPLSIEDRSRLRWWQVLLTPKRSRSESVRIRIKGAVTVQPEEEIRAQLEREPRHLVDQTIAIRASIQGEGTPIPVQAGILVLLVAAVATSYSLWLRPAPPVSRLATKVQLNEVEGPSSETLKISPSNGRRVVVGNGPDADVKAGIPAGDFALSIESKRPRFFRLSPRRGLYAHAARGYVSYSIMRRGRQEERPLPTQGNRAIPLNSSSRLVVSDGARRFEIRIRR